jgi:photosystem II stability/assembly factor-like uncharacterized protein
MRLRARGRKALLAMAAAACAAAAHPAGPAAPADPPAVLREAAVASPKALGAATLAVARAGTRLVAAGERGTVLLSDDAGTSWRQAKVPVQVSLTALRFVDARTGWAAGHLGTILKTEDGGESWALQLDGVRAAALWSEAAQDGDERAQRLAQQLLEEGPDKPFFDLEFVDAQHGVAVGAYNLAFATADGGRTWTPLSARLPNPKSLHLYAVRTLQGKLFIAGEQGLLLRSDDGGASFAPLASPYKGSWFGLLAARSGTLIAHGLRGNVFRSTDLGASWQKVESGVPVSIGAAAELDGGALVLLTQTGELLASRDDGRSFTRSGPGAAVPAAGLAVTADGQVAVASLRGMRRVALP